MKLLIAMPAGPLEVEAQKVTEHEGIRFFINECPVDPGLYRATEYSTGRAFPFTKFPTMAETERAARSLIDYRRPASFRKALSGVPILNP